MYRTISLLAIAMLMACTQEALIEKFSSPEDQALAKVYIDHLRARKISEIEKALDPSLRTTDINEKLTKMAELVPSQEPTSTKVVGAQKHHLSDATTINTTFEYDFWNKWIVANVAIQDKGGIKTIVGFNVHPMQQSLETQNQFSLVGRSAVHYGFLAAAVLSFLLTLFTLIVCIKTKFPRRKWLWVLFVLTGFGKFTINWTTGEWGISPFALQFFGASAGAQLYGPWMISFSIPLGALIFLFYKRPRLVHREGEFGSNENERSA